MGSPVPCSHSPIWIYKNSLVAHNANVHKRLALEMLHAVMFVVAYQLCSSTVLPNSCIVRVITALTLAAVTVSSHSAR